ncbi:MAG TPA: ADOP family duplicated permease [Thermoanaerobaculia bacterium]|nr:ADOP family duplicated permease [Thermoanaerobaculia bacterium]
MSHGTNHLADARQDLFYAARGLVRQPGFTFFIVLTLALGIGANSAIFGLLDRLLLSSPPHIRDADQVVRLLLGETIGGSRFSMSTTSYPAYRNLRDNTRSFAGLAAAAAGQMVLGRGADASAIQGAKVTGNYFQLLGVQPHSGRFFGEAEDRPPYGLDVAVLSHAFWRRQLAGDPGAVGRNIVLDGASFTVIGIAPPGFTGDGIKPLDVWVPLSAGMKNLPADWRENRSFNIVALVARLEEGVSQAAAQQEATQVHNRDREIFASGDSSQSEISFLPLLAAVGPNGLTQEGRIALWLGGVALCVLLIAVGNVTNLLLLRTARRQHEVAVCLALGMSRGRLIRLLVTESLLLATLGGLGGLLVAYWGGNLTRLTLLPDMASPETLVQPRIFVVTALAALLAGLIAGLLPARQASATSLTERLAPGSRTGSFRRSALLTSLLLLQTGLSAVLLAGAGLFVASLYNVRTQSLGFTTERLLLAEVPAGGVGQGGSEVNQDSFYRTALERVRMLPGVEMAIPVDALPFGAHTVPPISVPGHQGAPGQDTQLPFMNAATPEYFQMMGMTIVRGRGFTAADNAGSPLVVLVNETMARTVWPSEDAIGKCIRIGHAAGEPPSPAASPSLPCREVVGIVNDARRRSIRPEAIPIMQYYVPFEQVPPPLFPDAPMISGLLIRTTGEPAPMIRPIQKTMQSVGSDAPYIGVRPYQDFIDRQVRPWQLGATLFSLFGGLALIMAAIGLYGVLAYMVTQRRKEIGIKMAIGATSGRVVQNIVGEGLAIALLGVGIGGLVVLAMGPWFEPLLFDVKPRDPAVLAGVALTLMAVAVLASLIPALRATRVRPTLALSRE